MQTDTRLVFRREVTYVKLNSIHHLIKKFTCRNLIASKDVLFLAFLSEVDTIYDFSYCETFYRDFVFLITIYLFIRDSFKSCQCWYL